MNDGKSVPSNQNENDATDSVEKTPPAIITAAQVKLIDDTIASIIDIYTKGVINTMLEIGELIYKKICKNDPNYFKRDERAKKGTPKKWHIFEQLAIELEKKYQNGENLPKKTWLYNAVSLVIVDKQLSDSPDYKMLSISHKIALLPVDDNDKKLAAAKHIKSNSLSVRKTRDYVSGLLETEPENRSIKYLINHPDEIGTEADSLKKLAASCDSQKKIKGVIEDCEEKLTKIKKEIAERQESIDKLEALIEQVKEVKPERKKGRKKKEAKKSE